MRRVAGIAWNTFRETIRDKILNVIVLFAVAMIASSVLLGSLTIGQTTKIVMDLGLAALELFGAAIAIFVGTSLVSKEIDKRTVYVVLTKPVARHQFLLGKFLGLLATLAVLVCAMAIAYLGVVFWQIRMVPLPLVGAVGLIGLELVVLTALAMLFSTFSTPVMSMVYTLLLFFIGHNSGTLRFLAKKATPAVHWLALGAYYVLPDLSRFDAKDQVVYGAGVSAGQWGIALAYGAVYTVVLLAVANVVLLRREF